MTKINAGGPAFPQIGNYLDHKGMSEEAWSEPDEQKPRQIPVEDLREYVSLVLRDLVRAEPSVKYPRTRAAAKESTGLSRRQTHVQSSYEVTQAMIESEARLNTGEVATRRSIDTLISRRDAAADVLCYLIEKNCPEGHVVVGLKGDWMRETVIVEDGRLIVYFDTTFCYEPEKT